MAIDAALHWYLGLTKGGLSNSGNGTYYYYGLTSPFLEVSSSGAALTLSIADSFTLSDFIETDGPITVLVGDTIALSDALEITSDYTLDISDVLALTDSALLQTDCYVSFSDTLAISDATEPVLGNIAEPTDAIALSDAITSAMFAEVSQSASDALSFTDDIAYNYGIYVAGFSFAFTDTIEIGDEEIILQIGPDTVADSWVQIFTGLRFSEENISAEVWTASDATTLSFSDAIEIYSAGAMEFYDTLFYGWGDAIQMTLEQGVIIEDTLALSDDASVALIIFVLNVTLSDTLVFSDAFTSDANGKNLSEDNFTISDYLEVSMTATLSLIDTVTIQDAVATSIDTFGNNSDALSLTDTVSVLLATQTIIALSIAVTDNLALSDFSNLRKPLNMTGYLRRYLNDVELV